MAKQREGLWPGEVYEQMFGGREIAYRIYPSLLDKYQQLLEYEEEAEKPWNKWSETSLNEKRVESQITVTECEFELNRLVQRFENRELGFPSPGTLEEEYYLIAKDNLAKAKALQKRLEQASEGDYILTPEEMYDKIERELIDTINREPHEPSEAADKGTTFNEIIDCIIQKKKCSREDMTIQTIKIPDGAPICIRGDFDGFTFDFDVSLCRQVANDLRGSICQYLISAPIRTKYGDVLLYGYLDYWNGPTIIDLKTTSSYEFGKYSRKWQSRVYPFCAIEGGLAQSVDKFVYYVVQLGKGKIIKGNIYKEEYSYNHEQCKRDLTAHVESFLRWIRDHKNKITDKKIFNQLTD